MVHYLFSMLLFILQIDLVSKISSNSQWHHYSNLNNFKCPFTLSISDCFLLCLPSFNVFFVDLLRQIDNKVDEYVQGVKGMVSEKRNERLKHIQKLFSKSREYGDDKVQLAMQTYEMVRQYFLWTNLY